MLNPNNISSSGGGRGRGGRGGGGGRGRGGGGGGGGRGRGGGPRGPARPTDGVLPPVGGPAQAQRGPPRQQQQGQKQAPLRMPGQAMPAAHPAPTPIFAPSVTAPTPPAAAAGGAPNDVIKFTDKRFADFPLHPSLLANIKHASCSEVQALTLPYLLQGHDVLAQAKTGTGKTMAFLAPTVDSLIRGPARAPGMISCLIISPTRELASQIAVEAQGILPAGFKCVTVYGQTNVKADVRNLAGGCDILVGTPGRLNDLITNFGLSTKLAGVRHFILDEGDTLLDAGFKPEIVKICRGLPNRATHPRQSLLFSATVPASLKDVVSVALLPSYKHLSAIRPEDENTHERVPQDTLVVPWEQIYGAALAKIAEEIAANPTTYKIMVFLPTARGTAILYEAAQQLTLGNTWEIQSRMSQPARERSSAAFKVCQSGILFSSDVTARGMDFKGVGYVLQVGVPMNPEQYVHRLGRTARAGAEGRGSLILTEDELPFLHKPQMRKLPLKQSSVPAQLGEMTEVMKAAMGRVEQDKKNQASSAHLGYYNGMIKNKQRLIQIATTYAVEVLGCPKLPALSRKAVGMMGLKNLGLEIDPRL